MPSEVGNTIPDMLEVSSKETTRLRSQAKAMWMRSTKLAARRSSLA
jgi:hypothetical protein